nr:MAG TPA: hypothetical protein [Caudoviricetes sp.]
MALLLYSLMISLTKLKNSNRLCSPFLPLLFSHLLRISTV